MLVSMCVYAYATEYKMISVRPLTWSLYTHTHTQITLTKTKCSSIYIRRDFNSYQMATVKLQKTKKKKLSEKKILKNGVNNSIIVLFYLNDYNASKNQEFIYFGVFVKQNVKKKVWFFRTIYIHTSGGIVIFYFFGEKT